MSVLPKPTKSSSLNNVAVSDGFENKSATSMASKGCHLCEQLQTRAASKVAPTLQAASAMISSCRGRARSCPHACTKQVWTWSFGRKPCSLLILSTIPKARLSLRAGPSTVTEMLHV